MPLSSVIRVSGRRPLPMPEPLLPLMLGRLGLPALPAQSIEHLKHSVVGDDSAFREATGFAHTFSEGEALQSFRFG